MKFVVPRFFWRGNDLGLDLLNTEAADERGVPVDLLPDAGPLFDWAAEAGVVAADVVEACRRLPRRSQAALLDWVHRLRPVVRALVDPDAGRADALASEAFSALVGEVPVRLAWPAGGGAAGAPALPAGAGPPGSTELPAGAGAAGAPAPVVATAPGDRLRLALALAALRTVGLDRARIRRCEGERCVLLYYDSSRNRSRRWCDMASCGNRAKAAAHYRRSRRESS